MSTLILVTSDSGAGHLKREKRADRIQAFNHRLVTGPVPTDGPPETFFQRQRAFYGADGLFHEPWWFECQDLAGHRAAPVAEAVGQSARGRHPGDWVLPPRPVEAVDLALARRAWSAFGTTTPEARSG